MTSSRSKRGQFVSHGKSKQVSKGVQALRQRHAMLRELRELKKKTGRHLRPTGRRLVALDVLAEEMWCSNCNVPLSLRYLCKDTTIGLSSELSVRCHECLQLKTVSTDRKVRDPNGVGRPLVASVCKAALGCLDSGIGHEQLNVWLSCLNVPTINRNTMKLAEERVGPYLENVAKESCQQAIMEEREKTVDSSRRERADDKSDEVDLHHDELEDLLIAEDFGETSWIASDVSDEESYGTPEDLDATPVSGHVAEDSDERSDVVDITAKFDCGWQKRGHGRCYDSHSGQGCAIGWHTNKILGFETLSKHCFKCNRGHDPSDHKCSKNFEGSSKSMEPEAAVRILLKNPDFENAGVRLGSLVGDADSSTMAAINREATNQVNKILDTNHGVKGFSRALWNLKTKKRYSFLNKRSIDNLKICLSYALAQNRNNVEKTELAIRNVLNHVYGDHAECGKWCKAKNNTDYVYKWFPGGKPLSCPNFKEDLSSLLNSYAAIADQLAPGGSTQQCESFNHMVATRAPKSRHYAGTFAQKYRTCSAVATKNCGSTYIEKVYEKLLMTPSFFSFRTKLQKRRERKAKYQRRWDQRRRRLVLKNQHAWDEAGKAQAEGMTYVSGMGTAMERATAASGLSSWLPEKTPLHPDCALVTVDIETTGFRPTDQIVQVAAKCGDNVFNVYIVPSCSFNQIASEKTGLSKRNNQLFCKGQVVATETLVDAACRFLEFLQSCGPQVLLVGHNLIRFDAPRLIQWMKQVSLVEEFCGHVYGFFCTMPVLKQGKVQKQEVLAAQYLTSPEWVQRIQSSHNALGDCVILDGLLEHFSVTRERILKGAVSIFDFIENLERNARGKENVVHLEELSSYISPNMMKKMAAAGVTVEELVNEYKAHERSGLDVCLAVRINGKPRVTNRSNIIDEVERFIVDKLQGKEARARAPAKKKK